MSALATPLVVDAGSAVHRLNPVTKLAATLLAMVGLLIAGDVVTPSVVLVAELVLVAAAGIGWRTLLLRTAPLVLGSFGLLVSTLLFAQKAGGTLLAEVGPIEVTSGGLAAAAAVSVRILAIALPGIVAFATTDPTELGDALVQHLHAPPRFTFGALAAFRLLPLLGDEWQLLSLARRARGIDAGRSPFSAIRLFFSAVFGLLVAAIRKAVRLATAMEARGFGRRADRTLARPSPLRASDALFLAATVAVLVGANLISVALGTWSLLFW
ncbi:energy-coupling factor transporter transmembrane component T family protein [Flindersiella endophytica]